MILAIAGELTAVAAITLLSVSISYSFASSRRAHNEISELRHENATCTWRQAVLIETMHAARIPVPSWIWREAPEGVAKMSPEEQRNMAARMIDPFGGVDPEPDAEP